MKRIMYIEDKSAGLRGPGRIGWVEMSRSTRSYVYAGQRFLKTSAGYKYNCIEESTGARFWISGPKRRGGDALYGELVDIDEDAQVDYWTDIRRLPQCAHLSQTR